MFYFNLESNFYTTKISLYYNICITQTCNLIIICSISDLSLRRESFKGNILILKLGNKVDNSLNILLNIQINVYSNTIFISIFHRYFSSYLIDLHLILNYYREYQIITTEVLQPSYQTVWATHNNLGKTFK